MTIRTQNVNTQVLRYLLGTKRRKSTRSYTWVRRPTVKTKIFLNLALKKLYDVRVKVMFIIMNV